MNVSPPPEHFEGKDAVAHVVEAQARGIIASTEIHGAEIPGHISAGADAAKETALYLVLIWIALQAFSPEHALPSIVILSLALFVWKAGRSAWLGWSRLERLHRVLEQEKWEIEHHRQQEREELGALYKAKGFEGKLLEDVLDVLMADGDRLLRVMVEEELGLSLQTFEHPLKQGFGAGVGSLIASILCLAGAFFFPVYGIFLSSVGIILIATAIATHYEKNALIPALVWNLGLVILPSSLTYFLLKFLLQIGPL